MWSETGCKNRAPSDEGAVKLIQVIETKPGLGDVRLSIGDGQIGQHIEVNDLNHKEVNDLTDKSHWVVAIYAKHCQAHCSTLDGQAD